MTLSFWTVELHSNCRLIFHFHLWMYDRWSPSVGVDIIHHWRIPVVVDAVMLVVVELHVCTFSDFSCNMYFDSFTRSSIWKKIKNRMVLWAIMIETETKSNQTNRGTVWRVKVQQMQSAPLELQFNGIWKYKRGIFVLHWQHRSIKHVLIKDSSNASWWGNQLIKKIKPDDK